MISIPLHPPLHPRMPSGADRGDALAQAKSALNAQRPQDAQRLAETVLKADPRDAKALHVLGCALLMQGRANDAVVPLESAARSLRDPETDTLLAIALRQGGRPEDALSRLKRATKRQPPYAAAFHELGYLLFFLKRYDDAIEALRRGVEIAPMMPEMSIQLGYVFLRCRNCADAKIAFARALGISPASPDALYGMAKSHHELGENEAAAAYLRRYLAVKPADASAWLRLGHCLLDLGQSDAGFDCFRRAARGDQTHYANALTSLASSSNGRFWLKPSEAARYLRGSKS